MNVFDKLRAEISSNEQNPYALMGLAIEYIHSIEKQIDETGLTNWFSCHWAKLECGADELLTEITNLKIHLEQCKKH